MSEKYVYPCTIVKDRYNGAYAGSSWTAWYLDSDMVPDVIHDGDIECMDFWNVTCHDYVIGKGETPEEAYSALYLLVKGN